jgi:predicted MFS family arabinose efflux permease
MALGFAMAGVGLGVALVPQYATLLIAAYGWRTAYVGLGIAIVCFALVPVACCLREPPRGNDRQPGRPEANAQGLTLSAALRNTPEFWMMTVAFFLVVVAINGTLAHTVALLSDRGMSVSAATAALSASGVALTIGRIAAGYCLDRFFGPRVAIAFFVCAAAGVALLASGAGGAMPLVGTILCGLGIGAEIDLMAFLVSRYFGLRALATIYGIMFAVFTIGSGLGPHLMSLSFDGAHSYTPALIAFMAALLMASAIMARLGPYRFPASDRR